MSTIVQHLTLLIANNLLHEPAKVIQDSSKIRNDESQQSFLERYLQTSLNVPPFVDTPVIFTGLTAGRLEGYDVKTGRFTAPYTGLYSITASLAFSSNSSGSGRSVCIGDKHGSTNLFMCNGAPPYSYPAKSSIASSSITVRLKAGESIYIYAFHNADKNLQILPSQNTQGIDITKLIIMHHDRIT